MTEPKQATLGADQSVVIAIAILNSSSADIALTESALTGGSWRGPPPVPGTTLAAGVTGFVNAGPSTFNKVGGYLTLVPAGGGSISLSWGWSPGESLMAYGNLFGTSALILSYSVTGVATFHPTVTFVITDPGAAGEQA